MIHADNFLAAVEHIALREELAGSAGPVERDFAEDVSEVLGCDGVDHAGRNLRRAELA